MVDRDDARHQTYANLEMLWSSGHPQILPVSGTPWCQIRLDPQARRASIRTLYQAPEPDVARLLNIEVDALVEEGLDIAVLTVHTDNNIHGVYGLLAAIADGVQIDKNDLAVAVAAALERFKDVLAPQPSLTEEIETGLFGELSFLRHLIRRIGPADAIGAWLGPLSEEHDFALPGLHVEVKTTRSERRRHVIGGLSQLVPLPPVPLIVLSIQITHAEAQAARTLPALIADVRGAARGHAVAFDAKIGRLGWDPNRADLYRSGWALRSTPQAYFVDELFPALTSTRLARVIPNMPLVSDVSYRVDLTDLESHPIPEPYGGFGLPKDML